MNFTLPMLFPDAIAREEGFYKAGSRAQRNNNPGDIEWGKFAIAHGATHAEQPQGRFAVFPTAAIGRECLIALINSVGYKGDTVEQFFNRYAPSFENQTNRYTSDVCAWCECKSTDLVSVLMSKLTQNPTTGS